MIYLIADVPVPLALRLRQLTVYIVVPYVKHAFLLKILRCLQLPILVFQNVLLLLADEDVLAIHMLLLYFL